MCVCVCVCVCVCSHVHTLAYVPHFTMYQLVCSVFPSDLVNDTVILPELEEGPHRGEEEGKGREGVRERKRVIAGGRGVVRGRERGGERWQEGWRDS